MKHIILIGFKSVGKSALGKELATELGLPFVDLDQALQQSFAKKEGLDLNSREIMQKIGQDGFRSLEHETLKKVLQSKERTVISLGGGAPMFEASRPLIASQKVILITAPKNIVYERIMVNGRPAFFSPDEHPLTSFNKLWEERAKVYEALSNIKVDNLSTIQAGVDQLKLAIKD